MPTAHAFIATSLDGYIARPDGSIDWLESANSAGEDHGYEAFIATVGGLIMGRSTFETVLGFETWPYTKPVIVLSRQRPGDLVPKALADRVTQAASPSAGLAEAGRRGWERVYVDGGQVIQSFLREGLLADLIITRLPILLGSGRPLFGPLDGDVRLRHGGTTSFPSGLVHSRYEIAS